MARNRDNPFSHKNSPYEHPLRSWTRRLRGRLSLLALALLVLVLGISYRQGTWLASEGQLHSTHAFLADDCAACHSPPTSTAAHGGDTLTANCMRCHRDMNSEPHGSSALVDAITEHKATRGQAPVRNGFIAWANTLPGGKAHPQAHAHIACSVCHQEHRGQDARQTVVSEATCQACHRSAFTSFAKGHPAFTDPGTRPSLQVKFDHVLHYGGAFAKQGKTDVQCQACHEQPTSAATPKPRLKTAETMCLSCHRQDAEPRDAMLLTSDQDEPTGFARLAMLLPKLRGAAAAEHPPSTTAQLTSVVGGQGLAMIAGITDAMLAKTTSDQHLTLKLDSIPAGSWAASNPDEGDSTVQVAYRSLGHRDPQIVGWLLWLQSRDREARKALKGADLTDWSTAAGDFLLDMGVATAAGLKPSRCAMCHFIGNDPKAGITVDFQRPRREAHFTKPYSHFLHASQAEQQGATMDCRGCHQAATSDPGTLHDARWKAIHVERRPQDWRPIDISDCRSCHNATMVRQDCATCHQYHQADP